MGLLIPFTVMYTAGLSKVKIGTLCNDNGDIKEGVINLPF